MEEPTSSWMQAKAQLGRTRQLDGSEAHGIKAVFPLANALVKLNVEGTKLLTSHPDNPSMDNLSTNEKGMLETLEKGLKRATSAPPSACQVKKNNSSKYAVPKEKPVTAGLARLHLLDDSHENGRLNGKLNSSLLSGPRRLHLRAHTNPCVYAYYSRHHGVRKHHIF